MIFVKVKTNIIYILYKIHNYSFFIINIRIFTIKSVKVKRDIDAEILILIAILAFIPSP